MLAQSALASQTSLQPTVVITVVTPGVVVVVGVVVTVGVTVVVTVVVVVMVGAVQQLLVLGLSVQAVS
jgi:hypothetical protein